MQFMGWHQLLVLQGPVSGLEKTATGLDQNWKRLDWWKRLDLQSGLVILEILRLEKD